MICCKVKLDGVKHTPCMFDRVPAKGETVVVAGFDYVVAGVKWKPSRRSLAEDYAVRYVPCLKLEGVDL
jgi:hypothetical protein